VSQATFFRWKQKFGGLGVGELRRLRQLEEENKKLKQLVADLDQADFSERTNRLLFCAILEICLICPA